MEYYLIKNWHVGDKRKIEEELIDQGRIGLGWSRIDLSQGESAIEKVRQVYEPDLDNRAWGKKKAVIRRFQAMPAGSRVFVRIGKKVYFATLEDDEVIHNTNCPLDLQNQRRVLFEKGGDGNPISMLVDDSPSEMRHQLGQGSRGIALKKLSGVIDSQELERLWGKENPFSDRHERNLARVGQEITGKIKKTIQGPSSGTAMAPGGSGFEALVGEMLRAAGYTVEPQATHALPAGADIDMVATRPEMFERSVKLAVQVKNYSGEDAGSGAEQLRKAFREMGQDQLDEIDEWVVITTGDVPSEVVENARDGEPSVRFVDGNTVAKWLLENAWKLSSQWRKALGLSEKPWHVPVEDWVQPR